MKDEIGSKVSFLYTHLLCKLLTVQCWRGEAAGCRPRVISIWRSPCAAFRTGCFFRPNCRPWLRHTTPGAYIRQFKEGAGGYAWIIGVNTMRNKTKRIRWLDFFGRFVVILLFDVQRAAILEFNTGENSIG